MTMPASQPVDYVRWLHADVVIGMRWKKDRDLAKSLATQLTELREAQRGCGKSILGDAISSEDDICEYGWLCASCHSRFIDAITTLTHTTQGEDHA